jgi:hypothetical protein
MLLSSFLNQREVSEAIADPIAKDPIEHQILAAGNLSGAQVEAIRGFQRRKGLTFGEAAITLGLVRRDGLFLALSKRYNYPVLSFGSTSGASRASSWSDISRSAQARNPSGQCARPLRPARSRRARTPSP